MSLAAVVAAKAIDPHLPCVRPDGAAEYDVVLHALAVACGVIEPMTSADLGAAIFRARSHAWLACDLSA